MDTEPLPAVPSGDHRQPRRPGRVARGVEAVAGTLSAGLLVIGLALMGIQVTVDLSSPAGGLAAAHGPGWVRVLAQLGVGVIGEALVAVRGRVPFRLRGLTAMGMTALAVAVLWLCWWN